MPIPSYSQNGALDPADIKSIQCVVGRVEDRSIWGLVDRSGPWHMQYLLRRISRRRHGRTNGLCENESRMVFGAVVHGVSCIVCLGRHRHRARAPAIQLASPSLSTSTPFTMPAVFHLFLQALPRIVRWARPILIEAGAELLALGNEVVVYWAARCVSFFFSFLHY
jgi:hypothetical protein